MIQYPILNIVGSVLFVFLVFPKVFRKPKKPSGKPNIPKKTKENKQTFRKTNNTKENQRKQTNLREHQQQLFLKVSDPPLDMGLFVLLLWFSLRFFYKTKQYFEKTTNTKENKRKPNKPSGQPKNNVFKSFRPTLGYGFVFVCYCWCSRRFFGFF